MILKLNKLLLTPTSLGNVWVALADAVDCASGGCFIATGYFISAFDTTGRVWISNQSPECCGEGMETTADVLADYLIDQLFCDGVQHRELTPAEFGAIIGKFYRQGF